MARCGKPLLIFRLKRKIANSNEFRSENPAILIGAFVTGISVEIGLLGAVFLIF